MWHVRYHTFLQWLNCDALLALAWFICIALSCTKCTLCVCPSDTAMAMAYHENFILKNNWHWCHESSRVRVLALMELMTRTPSNNSGIIVKVYMDGQMTRKSCCSWNRQVYLEVQTSDAEQQIPTMKWAALQQPRAHTIKHDNADNRSNERMPSNTITSTSITTQWQSGIDSRWAPLEMTQSGSSFQMDIIIYI